jgi:hypothetical protein
VRRAKVSNHLACLAGWGRSRAGCTSVSFTLDRYGHLLPGHDAELRDRLHAMHAEGLEQTFGGAVVDSPMVRPEIFSTLEHLFREPPTGPETVT